MLAVLREASQESGPPWPIELCGRLHDAALGAIYYAKTKKGRKAPESAKDQSLIAKTIDLKDQNIYAVVLDSKRTILRDHDRAMVLCTYAKKEEAYEWLDIWCEWPERSEAQVSKVAWLRESIDRDGAKALLSLNEYLTEAMVGYVLTKGYEKLAQSGAEMIVTPETAISFLYPNYDPRREPFDRAVEKYRVPVWLGGFGTTRNPNAEDPNN